MTATIDPPSSHQDRAIFPDTHWSAVSAARGADSSAAKHAIDSLCATYWKPIYSYIRVLGRGAQDAEDLTQEFFRQLMVRGNLFLSARREQGKLRSYVCVAVKRLVVDASRKDGRLKRGGQHEIISLERADEPAQLDGSPDEHFDRQWAKALLDRTLTELERDYVARGKAELFSELRPFLGSGESQKPQEDVADRLGMNLGALRMALSRLRKQFGEAFRREVEATVISSVREDVDTEISYLIGLFAR